MSPAVAASPSLAAVKRLGDELLLSRSHVNNLPALLSILSRSSQAPECLRQAITYLQAFFSPLLRRHYLAPDSLALAKGKLQEQSGDAEAIYVTWLSDKYNELVETLLKSLTLPSVQVAALDALMEFTRNEKKGRFSNKLFARLCSSMVGSPSLDENIVEVVVSKYMKYLDVRYYMCINLEKIIAMRQRKSAKGLLKTEDGLNSSENTFVYNAYEILSNLASFKVDESMKESTEELWAKPQDLDTNKNSEEGPGENLQMQKISYKKYRSKFSKAWLAFLRLPLPLEIYRKVLTQLHKIVIPHLTNPILLSDFLTNSYNVGGVISVMALNGLFLLITQHGLEYPDFYNKLYALLEPSIFLVKYRARFFELVDTCLKSTLLPSYLAAAFAKKLGRLSLSSPPSGALIAIAMLHNLLRRHPSINCLVHQNDACMERDDSEQGDEENGITKSQLSKVAHGVDHFDEFETDTSKCNALASSLWEVETLRRHYCPIVSRFILSLETDLTVRAKTAEVAIRDFSSGSYGTIFSEEVGRRMKQVPLAFYKSIPTSLFSSHQSADVGFPGWKFDSEVDSKVCLQTDGSKLSDGDGAVGSERVSEGKDGISGVVCTVDEEETSHTIINKTSSDDNSEDSEPEPIQASSKKRRHSESSDSSSYLARKSMKGKHKKNRK